MIKKYWPEILVFTAIFVALLVCLSPGLTWMNTDSDGSDYLLAAKYMTTAHNTSAPLYLLLGRAFLYLPFGSEAWRLGLISVLGTMLACVFIYKIVRAKLLMVEWYKGNRVRQQKKERFFALIAVLIYGGSALVISQSTIIETYALVTGLLLGAYYFATVERYAWSSIFLGITLAIHPLLMPLVWVVMLFTFKRLRKWKHIGITLSFIVFYAYVPIVGMIEPNSSMWMNTNIQSFIMGNIGTMTMLTGGLSIWSFPKRIIDMFGIMGVSMGIGFLVLLWWMIRTKKILRNHLFWLFMVPVLYFVANLADETYVYLIVAIGFGAVIVGIELSKVKPTVVYATGLVAIALLTINANYFDLGRTLDPEMSAEKFYQEELTKIPDGDIYMGSGWNWAMVYLFNRQENRNIIPVSIDTLPADGYLEILRNMGIVYADNHSPDYYIRQGYIAQSLVEMNKGVWVAIPTKPQYYQYEVYPANLNLGYITRFMGNKVDTSWKWMPSNPYKYISGQLEVSDWVFITYSNMNVRLYAGLASGGLILNWIFWKIIGKKKEDEDTMELNNGFR